MTVPIEPWLKMYSPSPKPLRIYLKIIVDLQKF